MLQKIDEGLRLSYPPTCAPELAAMAVRCHALKKEDRPLFAQIDQELTAVLEPMMDSCRDIGAVLNGKLEAKVREKARQSAELRGQSLGLHPADDLAAAAAAAASPPGSPATKAKRAPRPNRPKRPTAKPTANAAPAAGGDDVVRRRKGVGGSRKQLSANRRRSINLSAVNDDSLHVPASFDHLSLNKNGTIERKKRAPALAATEEGAEAEDAAAAAAYKAAQDAKFNRPDADVPALHRTLSKMNFSSVNREKHPSPPSASASQAPPPPKHLPLGCARKQSAAINMC